MTLNKFYWLPLWKHVINKIYNSTWIYFANIIQT